ncbi:MAG: FAD-binding protein [Hyphomicrobiales bacterium]|nr:FAD-binding protein [Hyphomicrobiales bacterium]
MTVRLPHSEAEAAEMIRAVGSGSVRLCGGDSRSTTGAADALSSRALTGIVRHEPVDRTICVRAGTPVSDVEQLLRLSGQCLAFEPPHVDEKSTIGAVAATNSSGPRRPFAGAARDALLGLRMVTGQGEVVATGSKVLKNVAGLDLTKVVAGSRGSLALITEVIFKVMPLPETEKTLAMRGLSANSFPARIAEAMHSGAPITAATHLAAPVAARMDLDTEPIALLRLEGFDAAVAGGARRLRPDFEPIMHRDSARLWRAIRDCEPYSTDRNDVVWRIATSPATAGGLAQSLAETEAETIIDWRGGLITARHADPDAANDVVALLAGARSATARLLRGPPAAAPRRRLSAGLADLTCRLKQVLDPLNVFDTGPFFDGTTV